MSDLTGTQLRQLSKSDFRTLKRLFFLRELKLTGSSSRARDVVRQIEIKSRVNKHVRISTATLLAKQKECEILGAFYPERMSNWRPISKRTSNSIIDLSDFSFLDEPIKTTNSLIQIARAECHCIGFPINFDDEYVLDIAPYLVLGMMREKMAPVAAGGRLSGPTRKVLEGVGLRQFLHMRSFGRIPIDEVWPLPLRHRRRAGSTTTKNVALQPTTVELVCDQIADRVDSWLGQLKPTSDLTKFGASRLKAFVGEILNNAERHGRLIGDGEWVSAGFMARRVVETDQGDKSVHVCHLGFYNPGRPFSETMEEAPSDIKEQMYKYAKLHRKQGLSLETLHSVFALQDGISRFPQTPGNPSGGTGLMDVVEFANVVGQTPILGMQPKVAFISGSAYILFDGRYATGVSTPENQRRTQWFNPDNDVGTAPDQNYVKDMPVPFPGSIVTLRFVIDQELERGKDE